jgi:hypothetical protein
MRNAELFSFVKKLGVDGFRSKEMTRKIKNIRSQYLQEKRKRYWHLQELDSVRRRLGVRSIQNFNGLIYWIASS